MALNEIGPSSRERLTTLAKSIGREEFAMNVLEIPDEKVLDMLADELSKLYDMRSVREAYSGFLRNPPEPTPDSEPFNPTGAVLQFREELRALFGKFKGELNNREFIRGVAEIMVNWKSLLRSQMDENIDPKAQKQHKGKSAPFGSAYKLAVAESLRDWFKKEDWVRINTSGNIAGKCGTMKKGKPTTRCLPRKKAQSLTKAERKATVAKKVRGSKKGKQFVKNTDKAEFKKKK